MFPLVSKLALLRVEGYGLQDKTQNYSMSLMNICQGQMRSKDSFPREL